MTKIYINQGQSSSSSFHGHTKQEASELLSAHEQDAAAGALVPDPESATGYRYLKITPMHRKKFGRNEGKSHPSDPPAPELLQALGDAKKRDPVLIPQRYSESAGRNVRFAVVLPRGFDPKRSEAYDVLGLLPGSSGTIGDGLWEGDLHDRAAKLRKKSGLDAPIVVMPELQDGESTQDAKAILGDLMPFFHEHFNAEDASIASFDYSDLTELTGSGASKDAMFSEPSVGYQSFSTKEVEKSQSKKGKKEKKSEKKSFFFKPSLADQLGSDASGVLVKTGADHEIVSAADLDAKLIDKLREDSLPDRWDLKKLDGLDRPMTLLSKTGDTPFAVVAPPHFDVSKPHAVITVLPPAGTSLDRAVASLNDSGQFIDNALLVVADVSSKSAQAVSAAQDTVETEVLDALLSRSSLPVNLSDYRVLKLSGAPSSWGDQIKDSAAQSVKLPAPIAKGEDGWVQLAPTNNHLRAFPEIKKWGGTDSIPKALQKQGPKQGSFLVPAIDSKSIKSRVPFGVYLPPGYDPDSSEKYPVLLMLPGKGNPLHYWTSAGGIVPKLDRMMSGDGQKMIVVVAENTDSFWYDYDKNGKGDFGSHGKRDFEGHMMELVDYATSELNGNPKALSIAGISRGGTGAMSMAARHPEKFVSASSHSGLLALGHKGGVLAKDAETIAKQGHFGPADDPVWAKFNPADLVESGAFAKKQPKLLIDVGADDAISLDHALEMGEVLQKSGVDHQLFVAQDSKGENKHNWNTWAPMFESWIAFHQSAHGEAAKPRVPTGWSDISKKALDEHKADKVERRADLKKALGQIETSVEKAAAAVPKLLEEMTDARPYERIFELVRELEQLPASGKKLVEQAKKNLSPDAPLHAAEARRGDLEREASGLLGTVREARDSLERRFLGVRIEPPKANPAAVGKLDATDAASFKSIVDAVPEAKQALTLLVSARPELLGDKDSVTKERFLSQLDAFVSDGYLKVPDVAGFSEFLNRVATKRFDWRRGGYSHSVCSSMNLVFNHPGLILNLIKAARDDSQYKTDGVFSGDGARSLKPMGDFQAGFRPVEETGWGKDRLPPAQLGYERGFLRAIVDELSCSPYRLPDDRFAKLCDPVAVGISKISGQEVRYGYAFKIKDGVDLANAVLSQGSEGLAMGEVEASIDGGPKVHLHFPVFYDYDDETRTLAMQEWSRPEQRISIDDLELSGFQGSKGAAIYYRPNDDIAEWLTPEAQPNWDKIRPDRPKSKGYSRFDD